MKKVLLLVALASILINGVRAQVVSKANFQISFQNSSSKAFFDAYINIARININYKDNKAVALDLIFHDKDHELLDLNFEGDRYILEKKFKELVLPAAPNLAMRFLNGKEFLTDGKSYYTVKATLQRDSLIYQFIFYSTDITAVNANNLENVVKINTKRGELSQPAQKRDSIVYDTVSNGYARFKGNLQQVKEKLNDNLKKWKITKVPDSSIVISGIVTKAGSLENLTLKYGKPSQFSDRVSEFIMREVSTWWPASKSRIVSSEVRFFIRLNRDNSITFVIRES